MPGLHRPEDGVQGGGQQRAEVERVADYEVDGDHEPVVEDGGLDEVQRARHRVRRLQPEQFVTRDVVADHPLAEHAHQRRQGVHAPHEQQLTLDPDGDVTVLVDVGPVALVEQRVEHAPPQRVLVLRRREGRQRGRVGHHTTVTLEGPGRDVAGTSVALPAAGAAKG